MAIIIIVVVTTKLIITEKNLVFNNPMITVRLSKQKKSRLF